MSGYDRRKYVGIKNPGRKYTSSEVKRIRAKLGKRKLGENLKRI